jgi:hypothetical protein
MSKLDKMDSKSRNHLVTLNNTYINDLELILSSIKEMQLLAYNIDLQKWKSMAF